MSCLFDFEDGSLLEDRYSSTIPKIQYKPTSVVSPSPVSLCNTTKFNAFCDEIKQSNLDDDIKKFLLLSATRFIVFDYSKIAEFYCHASKEVQEIMEKLGLVIIDFNDAIENGFVSMTKNLEELYEKSKK